MVPVENLARHLARFLGCQVKPRKMKKGAAERAANRAKRAEIEEAYTRLEAKKLEALGDPAKIADIKAKQAALSEAYYSLRARRSSRKAGGGSFLGMLGR
jgi:hypothetical protein